MPSPLQRWLTGDRPSTPGPTPWAERLAVGQMYEAEIYLQDGDGQRLTPARLTDVRMSLYDAISFRFINERVDVDVRGFVTEEGLLRLHLTAEDTTPLDGARLARHIMLLEFTWDDDEKEGFAEMIFTLGKD